MFGLQHRGEKEAYISLNSGKVVKGQFLRVKVDGREEEAHYRKRGMTRAKGLLRMGKKKRLLRIKQRGGGEPARANFCYR